MRWTKSKQTNKNKTSNKTIADELELAALSKSADAHLAAATLRLPLPSLGRETSRGADARART